MQTGYFARGHDSPSGQYWYQNLLEIDDALPGLAWPDSMTMSLEIIGWYQAGFDWHATRNWWPDDGRGSRHDKMSSRHETPVTRLLPCALLSPRRPNTRLMGCICISGFLGHHPLYIQVSKYSSDLHWNLGKTGTNQQSNTNDINITDKWIQ